MSTLWRTHTTFILVIGILVLIIATFIGFAVANFQPTHQVRLGSIAYAAQLASTDAEREKGLSGVAALEPNEAMLFVFDEDHEWGIWMKDMEISLDIIWLDANREVVHIVRNAPPDDASEPKTYFPTVPARYVLEVPAGSAQANAIYIGDKAEFDIPEVAE